MTQIIYITGGDVQTFIHNLENHRVIDGDMELERLP